uniref:Uncharacterized protein n=1 Tax=Timema shepardi TaxID=629360 RepID=A0A7R9G503_TIMSH|nr:unnamed protein product [Timema shepardi]
MGYNVPRNYIKKKPSPPYSMETLQTAVADIENSNKTLCEASALTVYDEHEIKDRGDFIFNCDESGFPSDPSKLRALGEKGKPLTRVSGGSGKEDTTVLACVSAAGVALPPLIVAEVNDLTVSSTRSIPVSTRFVNPPDWRQVFDITRNAYVIGKTQVAEFNDLKVSRSRSIPLSTCLVDPPD